MLLFLEVKYLPQFKEKVRFFSRFVSGSIETCFCTTRKYKNCCLELIVYSRESLLSNGAIHSVTSGVRTFHLLHTDDFAHRLSTIVP